MTRLVFPPALREALIAHARDGDPDEVCGILAGQADEVVRVCPVRNIADQVGRDRAVFRDRHTDVATPGRRAVHYYMDPMDQLRTYDEIEAAGLDVVGYYHSHTRSEARPSPTDVRLARDSTACWVLVSLEDAQNPSVRAWTISKVDPMDVTGEVTEIGIVQRTP